MLHVGHCSGSEGAVLRPTPSDSVANGVDLLGDRRGALELEVQLEGLVIVEHLPAVRALHLAVQLDPHVLESSIARDGLLADLHGLRHGCWSGSQATTGHRYRP